MEYVNGKIVKIIGEVKECESKWNNKPNYYFTVRLNDGNKYSGFSTHLPYENDEVIGLVNLGKTFKDIYKFDKTVDLKLPLDNNDQINRIIKIIGEKEFLNETKINEIIDFYSKFEFGKNYWFYIYKYFIDCNTIADYKLTNYIDLVCNHISIYYDSMIKSFIGILKEKGITRLTKKQAIELYVNPNFGYNINEWKCTDLELLMKIEGFGIKTIIKLALMINGTLDDISRLLILWTINYNHNGNTYLKYDYMKWKKEIYSDYDIKDYLTREVDEKYSDELFESLNQDKFKEIIQNLIQDNKIKMIEQNLYSKNVFDIEMEISQILIDFNNNINMLDNINKTKKYILKKINSFTDYKLNDEQTNGILNIFKNNISVIYGKAGTGKTTLLKGFVETFAEVNKLSENNFSLYFLTPTGKAKMRMVDVLGELNKYIDESMTIHAFNFKFGKKQNKIDGNDLFQDRNYVFVIDESSMIDIYLLYDFLDIIRNMNCTIVFLGDIRQLPSIGPGCILEKIIKSNVFKSTELIQVLRNDGNIIKILDKVSNGQLITLEDCDDKKEFSWIQSDGKNEKDILRDILEKKYKSNIIITTNNSFISELTDEVRNIKNPKNDGKKEIIKNIGDEKIIYRVGDPVVHGKNNNEKKLANGLQGKIVDIDNNLVHVFFENKEDDKKSFKIIYDNELLKDLKPGYLISAHKSQGQEYGNIIIVLKKSILLNRNILYTGLSRAKKSILLISSKEVLDKCINKKIKRNSMMDLMIQYLSDSCNETLTFEEYYKNLNDDNAKQSNNDFEEITYRGNTHMLEKISNKIYEYDNGNFGQVIGIYNDKTNKVKKNKKLVEINV